MPASYVRAEPAPIGRGAIIGIFFRGRFWRSSSSLRWSDVFAQAFQGADAYFAALSNPDADAESS